jgi:glycosyltransferase involved in cell wall biosynthesis
MSIFVQIASYRDPQLIPTIEDLLKKAKYPHQLRIGICRQFHPMDGFDNLDRYKKDKRFRVIDVLYSQSKGACWARNITQRIYMGEDYTLQIDSHMRFAENWDVTLINMMRFLQSRGYRKPLITGYMAAFDPNRPLKLKKDEPPLFMAFDRFTPEGVLVFKSELIPDWRNLMCPIPARFYSAGFCFTLGQFCREVQHDPEFYFLGEEISITVRAFTHGYDLFHPNRTILWHYYGREKNVRQWDDDRSWTEKDRLSLRKNRLLFGIDGENRNYNFGKYGLGQARSLRDYERYAGVLFSKKAVQKYTLDKYLPPNPNFYYNEAQWLNSFLTSKRYCIRVQRKVLKPMDYDFWVVAFHDENDRTIFREDAQKDEIQQTMRGNQSHFEIWREFYAYKKLKYWVLWPHSASKGWCNRLTGKIS